MHIYLSPYQLVQVHLPSNSQPNTQHKFFEVQIHYIYSTNYITHLLLSTNHINLSIISIKSLYCNYIGSTSGSDWQKRYPKNYTPRGPTRHNLTDSLASFQSSKGISSLYRPSNLENYSFLRRECRFRDRICKPNQPKELFSQFCRRPPTMIELCQWCNYFNNNEPNKHFTKVLFLPSFLVLEVFYQQKKDHKEPKTRLNLAQG